jgi:hypothetical protein
MSAFLLVATCGSYSSHLIFSLSSCSRVTDSALSICGIEAATPIEFHRPVYRLEQMLTTSGADLWPVRSVAAASRELHEIIDLATPLPGGAFVYRFVIQTGSRKKFDRDAREAHAGRYAGHGRRRAWIALASGAVSALAQAPIHLWPILFLTFLVWLIDSAPAQRRSGALVCALTGWCFGFGYFVVCLLLGRPRVPGGRGDFRLAAAGRSDRRAGLYRDLHRHRVCSCAPPVGTRGGAHPGICRWSYRRRMAAWSDQKNSSLEHCVIFKRLRKQRT